ncbi:MAG: STAS domain-containing protein [Chloroflexi bacterium]|nr:STAS domain-containing protein [Chloroflexota bacterium]
MNLQAEFIDSIAILAPQGRVDTFSASMIQNQFEFLLEDGSTKLVADLSAVSFIDNAGITSLVRVMKQARANGGDLKVVWPIDPQARFLLDLTRIERVLDMTNSLDEARLRYMLAS